MRHIESNGHGECYVERYRLRIHQRQQQCQRLFFPFQCDDLYGERERHHEWQQQRY